MMSGCITGLGQPIEREQGIGETGTNVAAATVVGATPPNISPAPSKRAAGPVKILLVMG
jgi:hypothetical protein